MPESKYLVLDGGDIRQRDKAPDSATCIRRARREYEDKEVATVNNADWVTNYYNSDIIDRDRNCPLVPVDEASQLAWYLHDCSVRVFVEMSLMQQD